jgi:hypothetical protein
LENRHHLTSSISCILTTTTIFQQMETTSKHPSNRSYLIHSPPAHSPCSFACPTRPNPLEVTHPLSWTHTRPQIAFHETSHKRNS